MSFPSSLPAASGTLFASPHFLRNVLRLDAVSCAACGLLQLALPDQTARWFALPQPLLAYTGEFLLAYALLVAVVSTRRPVPAALVWALLAGNLGWAAGCGLLLATGQVSPTPLGSAYVALQAVTVLLLAALQYLGLSHLNGAASRSR
ncbi:MAG: hypothetical protein JWQ72_3397 [Polaromonas sp.]|nr:hypothetical protein [Polaromonas sp.]